MTKSNLGPYGWLIVDPALTEAEWTLQNDGLDENQAKDGLAAFPVYLTNEDQKRLASLTNQGTRSDEFDYINRSYGTDFKRDQRVKVDGRAGTITSANGAHIMVLFDGMPSPRPCHPTWKVTSGGDDK